MLPGRTGASQSSSVPEKYRSHWPTTEQKAAERVERAIDRLGALDDLEETVELDVFARTLELELESDLGRVGRMGEGVLVGSLRMGVGLELDLVIVLGMAEGSLPAPVRDDSLLPDHERAAAGAELPLKTDDLQRQHHELLAVLAGAGRHVLCVPRGDLRRNSDRVPSRWVLEIASTMAGGRMSADNFLGSERDWLDHVASFDGGLRRVVFPATAQEYRLRSLLQANSGRATPLESPADPILRNGQEVIAARRGPRFTRFDGNLGGLVVPSPADRVTSATRLEGWARCPFGYLVRDILGVEEVENPEKRLRISPLDLGSLIHSALERFIDEWLQHQPRAQSGPPGVAWSPADRARLREIGEEECDRYEAHGLVGRPIFWQRDRRRILADLERFLSEDDSHRLAHGTRPAAAELAFGLPGARLGTVRLPLPDGRAVAFRGKADRLDVAADGSIEILDYKTGRSEPYRDLTEDNPDDRGTKLQLVVYGLAARLHRGTPDALVRAEYWFTSAKGGFRRIGYEITSKVLQRASEAVGHIVDGIEGGVFPSYPTASSTSPFVECPYCDPDGLGVTDLRRQIERKRSDPSLAVFFDLAEPEVSGEGHGGESGEVPGV